MAKDKTQIQNDIVVSEILSVLERCRRVLALAMLARILGPLRFVSLGYWRLWFRVRLDLWGW